MSLSPLPRRRAQCELLSIATEESLATFSVDSFVPALVGLLNAEHNPDLMLLAARALTHLADVLPPSCAAIVHYQAVPCFCARLLTIEYIDLAEQSLQVTARLPSPSPHAPHLAQDGVTVTTYGGIAERGGDQADATGDCFGQVSGGIPKQPTHSFMSLVRLMVRHRRHLCGCYRCC